MTDAYINLCILCVKFQLNQSVSVFLNKILLQISITYIVWHKLYCNAPQNSIQAFASAIKQGQCLPIRKTKQQSFHHELMARHNLTTNRIQTFFNLTLRHHFWHCGSISTCKNPTEFLQKQFFLNSKRFLLPFDGKPLYQPVHLVPVTMVGPTHTR